jgi:hypothetical protein
LSQSLTGSRPEPSRKKTAGIGLSVGIGRAYHYWYICQGLMNYLKSRLTV